MRHGSGTHSASWVAKIVAVCRRLVFADIPLAHNWRLADGAAMLEARNPVRLVVFDCDGTLVDSQATIVACAQAAFRAEGLAPPAPEAIRRIVGLSLVEAVLELMAEPDPAAAPEAGRALQGGLPGAPGAARLPRATVSRHARTAGPAAGARLRPGRRHGQGHARPALRARASRPGAPLRHAADGRSAPEQAASRDAAGRHGRGGHGRSRPPCSSATRPTTS